MSVLALLLLNKKLLKLENNIFIFLVFGILSPVFLFINYEIPLRILQTQQLDKFLIIFLYFINSIYLMYKIVNQKKDFSSRYQKLLILLSVLSVNNVIFKVLVVLAIVLFHGIDLNKRPVRVTFESILVIPFLIFVISAPESFYSSFLTPLLLIITVKITLRCSTEINIFNGWFLISLYSIFYPNSSWLSYSMSAILFLGSLKFLLNTKDKEALIIFFQKIKFIERLYLKNQILNKEQLLIKNEDELPVKPLLENLETEVVQHESDKLIGFLLTSILIVISLFMGLR